MDFATSAPSRICRLAMFSAATLKKISVTVPVSGIVIGNGVASEIGSDDVIATKATTERQMLRVYQITIYK